MNVFASECSSGCESGWTLYFENSYLPSQRGTGFVGGNGGYDDEHDQEKGAKEVEDEEDLSMVSDASSGPPQFHEEEGYYNEENGCFFSASKAVTLEKNGGKRQKIREHQRGKEQELPSFLDDTASSPVINFSSKNNNYTLTNNQASMESILDFSQGFSANHFEGRSALQDHFGFLQSSLSGNQLQKNQWFEGKRMGMR